MRTADLTDRYPSVRLCSPGKMRAYGRHAEFHGPIRTVQCRDDFTSVRTALTSPGNGAVLVIDAGGSTRCAMVGDRLARFGIDNGWAGIVVNGMIRDSAEIDTLDIGIQALGTNPFRGAQEAAGEVDIEVTFLGVTFVPGHYLYADPDGIIVADGPLSLE